MMPVIIPPYGLAHEKAPVWHPRVWHPSARPWLGWRQKRQTREGI